MIVLVLVTSKHLFKFHSGTLATYYCTATMVLLKITHAFIIVRTLVNDPLTDHSFHNIPMVRTYGTGTRY